MKKSERGKALNLEEGVDLISSMPDAILVLILSRLGGTVEAMQSSILSRRWRYLWAAVPTIEIYGGKLKESELKEFMYWVFVNKSVDLDRFCLSCSNYYSMSTVWRLVHAAVTRNVKQLYLSFCSKHENNGDVEMPHCLVTCTSLKDLELELSGRVLRLPNINIMFPALRVLELGSVNFLEDQNSINNFLEGCPLLEDLTLLDCLTCKLNLLCISCVNLKKLFIMNAFEDEGMCGAIKVSCPKLVDLDLTGYIAYNIIFECLDSLKEAEIDLKLEGDTKCVLFPGISHVKSLLINQYFFSQCIKAASDPGLPNLKTLVLTTTIGAFTYKKFIRILKYYPKLESLKLVIKEEFYGHEEWELHEGDARKILTPDLKRVELFEFKGEKAKLDSDWHEITNLEMVFSWGKVTSFN